MSYNLTTMQSIHRVLGSPIHYIFPTAQAGLINFAPNYTAKNTTKLEFTFVPGTFNGSVWVGHAGVTPDIEHPEYGNDENDFRLISYNEGSNTRIDVHNQQEQLSTRLNSSTPMLKVEMWDYGINIWNKAGRLIETHTWTSNGTWDSNVAIYGWPVKAENGGVEVLSDFKLYSVKITDDILGVVYNGTVDANGLYDSVSQTYTTITGWEIGSEENNIEIVEITHNNSIVYQKSGPIPALFYSISPTSQAGLINFAPNYTARNTTKLEFIFVPGTFNGSAWVGHMGVIPDIEHPDRNSDENDFRLISYNEGSNTRIDVHSQQQKLSTRLVSSTPMLKVEMWDYGINIWNEAGIIETHTWTSEGTWDSNVAIYGWPVKAENGGVEVLSDFKLYSVKITDDILGVVYNGTVDANGLYDSVSQTYTTITGWNINVD